MAIYIDETLCPQSHRCPLIDICPMEAITQEGYGLPEINADECIECGECIKNCGMKAVYEK